MSRLRWEPRGTPPPLLVFAVSAAAVGAAFAVAGGIFLAYGKDPVTAVRVVLEGTLGTRAGLAEIARKATPLLLAGVGLAIAFRARFWNIGAEGQILAGAIAATAVALFLPASPLWTLPAMFAAGALAGGLWGLLPALLKVGLGVNEVLTTLMLNYVAQYLVFWLVQGPWKGRSMMGFAYTDLFPRAAWLPVLPGTRVHWPTAVLGVALAALAAALLRWTRAGYELRVLGGSPDAARYAGIAPLRTTLLVVLVSGGAAGLAGVGEAAGTFHRLLDPTQLAAGCGYTAILVAWLARGNPLAAVASALLLGFVSTAGDVMKVALQIPYQITHVINGLVLFFLIGAEPLLAYRPRWESAPAAAVAPAPAPAPAA